MRINQTAGIVVFIVTVLLIWGFPLLHPVLNYDEISAIIRAEKANNFTENIEWGVLPDGHPMGLQTLIFFLYHFIGYQPFAFKLVAISLGLWACFQGYQLGKEMHGKHTGYSMAIFLGLWWWNLQIGSMIRPYSIALPFVLLSWRWALKCIKSETTITNLFLWASFIAISGYFHHFAFLMSLMSIAFTASMHIRKKKYALLKPILWVIIGVVVIYFPNIYTLIAQMKLKGLGWLASPQSDFIIQFFQNYLGSYLSIILLISIVLSIYFSNQYSIILLGIFIVNYAIIHCYSVYISPVLQPSALYFSLPILWLSGAIGISELFEKHAQKWRFLWPAALSLAMVSNTLGKHQWFGDAQKNYHAEFSALFFQHPQGTWVDIDPDILRFYGKHVYHVDSQEIEKSIKNNQAKFQNLNSIIANLSTLEPHQSLQICLQASSSPWIHPLLMLNFNSVEITHQFIGGYILNCQNYHSPNTLSPSPHSPLPLNSCKQLISQNDLPSFNTNFPLSDFQPQPNDVIVVITPTLLGEEIPDESSEIVSTLHNQEKQIDWRSTPIRDFQSLHLPYAIHTLKLSDIPGWNQQTKLGLQIPFEMAWIGLLKGNPYQYGILE